MKLQRDQITCDVEDSMKTVAFKLHKTQVRHLFVLEDSKLVGVLGGVDINKAVADGKDLLNLKARNIMNNVEYAREGNLEHAYAIMRNFNTFLCPIVDGDKRMIGYYGFADVCEELARRVKDAD